MKVEIKDKVIFAPLKSKWLLLTPEEKVRQEYIIRLVNDYGYNVDQMAQGIKANNPQKAKGRAMADIVIWKNKEDRAQGNSPIIVVECKAESLTIRKGDYFKGYNFASWAGAKFFVTTNLKETRIFKVLKEKIPKNLDEIVDIPDASIANNEKKVEKFLDQTKAFTRDKFSRLLFKCHSIIRNNDKLSPEAAFDEISKILFIKIRYEKSNDGGQIFSIKRFNKDKEAYESYRSKGSLPYYKQLFENTKKDFTQDDLFANDTTIRIRENSFVAIVKELQKYNLSTTSDDVKGIAFERFLGRTFRGELGQFFTPRTIVDFMVEVLDPQEGEIICDPCCGSGGFLIKAFEYIRDKIENDVHKAKEKIKSEYYTDEYNSMSEKDKEKVDEEVNQLFAYLNYELDINNPKSRIKKLSCDCIFGTDANPRMSRTAKMNMMMHGDGHAVIHHHDGLLNVNGIFEERFDIILTNPPFGSRVEKTLKITEADKYKDQVRIDKYKKKYGAVYDKALEQIENNINKNLLSLYDTGKMSTLTEVLFIERCLNLLKPGGRMGIVLPEGILNNLNLHKIREYVESRAKILLIVSIPQDVFIASGATVKPSLVFFKKFTEEENTQYTNTVKKVTKEVKTAYAQKVQALKEEIAQKGVDAPEKETKKLLRAELKELNRQIDAEILLRKKRALEYEVPIAKVEKAGISTTGAVTENELKPLLEEFDLYCRQQQLWGSKHKNIEYQIVNDEKVVRMIAGQLEEIYG